MEQEKEKLQKCFNLVAEIRSEQVEKKSELGNVFVPDLIWEDYHMYQQKLIAIQKHLEWCMRFAEINSLKK